MKENTRIRHLGIILENKTLGLLLVLPSPAQKALGCI